MKKFIYILTVTFLGCNSEQAPDCFQTSGTIERIELAVDDFSRILVKQNVELIIKQEPFFKVEIEGGKNLLNEVKAEVVNNRLIITNNNTCNFVRNYEPIKAYIFTPNITEVISSTQFDVKSDGVLNFPEFTIISEDYINTENQSTGNFYLTLQCNTFNVVFNNLSNCVIGGAANELFIDFQSGNSRFEGEAFRVNNAIINHRGSNDMILFPIESIKGDIWSTGNVVLKNNPPEIQVTEHYKGKLILSDE